MTTPLRVPCGCKCNCHDEEADRFWPGPCAACCEPGMDCACGRALAHILSMSKRPRRTVTSDGDHLCQRLWPVAQCQWVAGHYGGCVTP